ncbi:MAG: hypothetical protein ACO294_09355 [Methylococcales bacterium]
MRAIEFLLEYKVAQTLKAPGKSQFVFQTASGMIYTISLKHDFDMEHHSQLLISFTTTDPKTGKLTNDRTNTGDSIAIFRTVQTTLLNYLNTLPKESLPDQLMFVADSKDTGRVSLYNTIAHSNKIPNYRFYQKMPNEHSNQILFIMQRQELDEASIADMRDWFNTQDPVSKSVTSNITTSTIGRPIVRNSIPVISDALANSILAKIRANISISQNEYITLKVWLDKHKINQKK